MKQRIAGFDGIRAIAVAVVLFNHKTGLGNALGVGGFGVRLFFVLSGFLIIGILFSRRDALEHGHSTVVNELRHFYENRLFRIWPPYFLTLALAIGIAAASDKHLSQEQILATITFTGNLFQAYSWTTYPDLIGPLWSVAVEEQFYLIAAPLFLLAPLKKFTTICWVAIAISVLTVAATVYFRWPPRSNYVGSLQNFGFMAIGGIAAISIRPKRWMASAAPWALVSFFGISLLCYNIGLTTTLSRTLSLVAGLLAPLILLGIVAGQKGWFVQLLEMPPLRYLGRISYGVYLYHSLINVPPVGFPMDRLVVDGGLTIIAAAISFSFMEAPLLKFRDQRRVTAKDASVRAEIKSPSRTA